MARTNLYRGLSTFEFQRNKSLSIRDIELVKLDLLNHIFTQRGTRVMMPNFGSIIPELAFEPLDEDLVDELYANLLDIFDYDPRVRTMSLSVTPDFDTNSVFAEARLYYVELDTVDDFELNIQFEG